ncbi:hypothetical protein ACFQGN_32630 [Streptomyces goshikiensis]|uniref:hypothetical protein n=1 Tax=Streptomyces goshikiensis TaxID=1942 RepID=UPI00361E2ADA
MFEFPAASGQSGDPLPSAALEIRPVHHPQGVHHEPFPPCRGYRNRRHGGGRRCGLRPARRGGSRHGSVCVTDLQAAQTSNNAAIAADQVNNTAAARTANLSTATSLVAAIGDCAGQVPTVGANVLTASASNAVALVYNLLGASASALSAEQATASSITQALAVAT